MAIYEKLNVFAGITFDKTAIARSEIVELHRELYFDPLHSVFPDCGDILL